MVINYENKPEAKEKLISLIASKILANENLYEDDLRRVLYLSGVTIDPDSEGYSLFNNPRRGWGWTAGTLKYFMSYDERNLLIPQSNKIDKDEIDELRSEDICIRANKTDILEHLKKIEDYTTEMALMHIDNCNYIVEETRILKQLIKGE